MLAGQLFSIFFKNQVKRHRCAMGGGIHLDFATVMLQQPLADGEAQSGSASFGCIEWNEEILKCLIGHPGAGILNADLNPAAKLSGSCGDVFLDQARLQAKCPTLGIHRLAGVAREIQADLVQLVGIADNVGQVIGCIHFDLDTATMLFCPDEGANSTQNFSDLDGLEFAPEGAGKTEKLAEDKIEAIGLIHDDVVETRRL